jgi:hypothetical protein
VGDIQEAKKIRGADWERVIAFSMRSSRRGGWREYGSPELEEVEDE